MSKDKYVPSIEEEIRRLQYNIIIHSIFYYYWDDSIVSDNIFDWWCKRLVELKDTQEFRESKFYEDFKDFNGETGCHLAGKYVNCKHMNGLAKYIMELELDYRNGSNYSPH